MDMEWLRVREAARIAKVSPRAIYGAIRSKQLRAARINERGELRVARPRVDQWLEALAGVNR